jgi:hypothetical protein
LRLASPLDVRIAVLVLAAKNSSLLTHAVEATQAMCPFTRNAPMPFRSPIHSAECSRWSPRASRRVDRAVFCYDLDRRRSPSPLLHIYFNGESIVQRGATPFSWRFATTRSYIDEQRLSVISRNEPKRFPVHVAAVLLRDDSIMLLARAAAQSGWNDRTAVNSSYHGRATRSMGSGAYSFHSTKNFTWAKAALCV